jgi:hypothetical protein
MRPRFARRGKYVSTFDPQEEQKLTIKELLKQHFKAHPQLESEAIFYHDCDIVFTRKPDFNAFLSDKIWYLSNTN